MTQHCIKCGAGYETNDPDPYYCSPCNEERKELATQIDAKIKPSRHMPLTPLQEYDLSPKVHGFIQVHL